ncbi:MAG: SAM-dependent methyltransferase [Bacteroidia bacterium]|jgi:methyltransferase (TIGR00027 family)|nr:SAM-dependent methyltransferase [Bacteroidia bacterium]
MSKAAANTGLGPIAVVAIEQYFPEEQRIIEDKLAFQILPLGMRIFVRMMKPDLIRAWMIRSSEKDAPGLWGAMICRKRYIGEKLIESVSQINSVVNLGSGFDTMAYRLSALSDMPVWEADQHRNMHLKQARLCKLFGAIPSHVRLVSIDFDREELDTALKLQGYSLDKRTFFILEAITQYLTETGIKKTFDFLARAASGSHLAFSYVRKDFINGKNMYSWEKGYKKYVVKDKLWHFGMDPEDWPGFLREYGWMVVEDIGYKELTERYITPTGRILDSTPLERIVYAKKL